MSPEIQHVLFAALGASIQEVVYWYNARGKLAAEKYRTLIKSPAYWLLTLAMVAVSALGTWVWFKNEQQTPRMYMVVGAGFPLLLKQAVSALLSKESKFGLADNWRLYFLN